MLIFYLQVLFSKGIQKGFHRLKDKLKKENVTNEFKPFFFLEKNKTKLLGEFRYFSVVFVVVESGELLFFIS